MANITKVYLLNVPLERDYLHTLHFDSQTDQLNYFAGQIVKAYTDFSYQRKEKSIKVCDHFDNLSNCNYLMYQNTAHSNKWYYCFINDIEYVSDSVSLLHIESDVIQTYLFDYQIEGIDVYSKRRKAYRFASIPQDEKERLLFYKHHLSVIQIFILRYALHYPRLFTPFWHEYICGSLCDIVEELFNIEYRNMYEIKLQGLMDKVGHIEYLDMDI